MKNISIKNQNFSKSIFSLVGISLLISLAACSKQPDYVEPQVDWRTKSPEVQERIKDKVNARDCAGLVEEINELSLNLQPGQQIDHEMFNYIADKQVQLGCQ